MLGQCLGPVEGLVVVVLEAFKLVVDTLEVLARRHASSVAYPTTTLETAKLKQ
jgi:hypothetical protein